MEDDLNIFIHGRRPPIFFLWKTTSIIKKKMGLVWNHVSSKQKTTSLFWEMEDDFNFLKMEDDLNYFHKWKTIPNLFFKWKTTLTLVCKWKTINSITNKSQPQTYFANGRWHKLFLNGRQPPFLLQMANAQWLTFLEMKTNSKFL